MNSQSDAQSSERAFETTILFGGVNRERLVSVASAQHLAVVLPDAELWYWTVDDTFIVMPRAELLAHPRPFEVPLAASGEPFARSLDAMLEQAARTRRLLLLGLHGGMAEDGRLARACELRGIPFTGSGSRASEIAFDKVRAKEVVASAGVRVAPALVLSNAEDARDPRLAEWLAKFGKLVAKPVADGSSYGLLFVEHAKDLAKLPELASHESYLLEAFMSGPEASVGVVDWNGALEVLPPVEIRKNPDRAFDYAGKYLGAGTSEVCPAQLPAATIEALQLAARTAHQAVGAFGYSRSDFIVTEAGPTFLEINTLPGMTRSSLIPLELAAAGHAFEKFLAAQIEQARRRVLHA
jgi:D-alanine-D-alanine ligase